MSDKRNVLDPVFLTDFEVEGLCDAIERANKRLHPTPQYNAGRREVARQFIEELICDTFLERMLRRSLVAKDQRVGDVNR